MEFLNLLLLLTIGILVWRKPEREDTAFRLVLVCIGLMMFMFLLATRGSFLPGLNY